MRRHKLQISLTEKDGKKVHLNSMTAKELETFLTVMKSFKSMVTALPHNDDIVFAIKDGSAAGVACSDNKSAIDNIVTEVKKAVKGNSDNKKFTDNLRSIQKHFIKNNIRFKFFQEDGLYGYIDLYKEIKQASIIQLRCEEIEETYKYKIEYHSGKLTDIGGKKPNYHLASTDKKNLIIRCSEEQAREITESKLLYNDMAALIMRKKASFGSEQKYNYIHKVIIGKKYERLFVGYLKNYYNSSSLVDRLGVIYDFVGMVFNRYDKNESLLILKSLIQAFNDELFHLSELKTILVVSKPHKNNEIVKEYLDDFYETYLKKKEKEINTAW